MPDTPTDAHLSSLLDTLRRSFDGEPWHGPSLADALRGVNASSAAAHPIPGAHSIWELTRHLTAWTREVARRLDGSRPSDPAEGDWPAAPSDSAGGDDAWQEALHALDDARDVLLGAVASMAPAQLDAWVPRRAGAPELVGDDPSAGRTTYAVMLAGAAEHNAYHAGQIAVLRRALGLAPSA